MNKLKIAGMHCQNCVKAVNEAVSALPGAAGVKVSLEKGEVSWEAMDVSIEEVKEAIEDIGFETAEPTCCTKKTEKA